jgi:hypothetical protein
MRRTAHTPVTTLASMIVSLLAIFHLTAPAPATAQALSVTEASPGPDGERALLGRVPGVPSTPRVSDGETSPVPDGARALLGRTASSVVTRTSAAGSRSRADN